MSKSKKSAAQIRKKRASNKKPSFLARMVRLLIWLVLIATVAGILGVVGVFVYLGQDLPRISTLTDYRPPTITMVYSDDNRKIGEFYKERRILVPLEQMPEMLKQAFVSAEDARFYHHQGVDIISIIRAFFKKTWRPAPLFRGAARLPSR